VKKNTILGLILIIGGLIWLLGNLDIVSFDFIRIFFNSLGTLWPLLLIGIGLSLLLKKQDTALKVIIWLIILVTIFVYGLYEKNTMNPNYDYNAQNFTNSKAALILSVTPE
jgi:hypothetical protein